MARYNVEVMRQTGYWVVNPINLNNSTSINSVTTLRQTAYLMVPELLVLVAVTVPLL